MPTHCWALLAKMGLLGFDPSQRGRKSVRMFFSFMVDMHVDFCLIFLSVVNLKPSPCVSETTQKQWKADISLIPNFAEHGLFLGSEKHKAQKEFKKNPMDSI